MSIHPTAIISPGAKLGEGVSIGPYAIVEDDVEIGDGCAIGPHVAIMKFTTLGPRCRVHAGAVLGDLPQDLGFKGDASFVHVGPDCVLREGVTVHRGTKEGTVTKIGAGCLLMANSHVGHNGRLGTGVILANGALVGGYGEIGDRAFISGNCMVHQFTRVGRLVMMSGGSAASADVPPFCLTRSNTTNLVLTLNVVGMRRAGLDNEQRAKVKRAFDLLYRCRLPAAVALQRMEQELDSEHVREFADFVRSTRRGICRFFRDVRSNDDDQALAA